MMLMLSSACVIADVHVKHHHGFMGPDTWEATDGKISVPYYNGNCCCVAEQVLQNLADKANSKEMDWSKMADPEFRSAILQSECRKVKGR